MHTLKTSRKTSIKLPDLLVTTVTAEQREKAEESVRKHEVAEFGIVGIEVKGIPSVRMSNHPIQPAPPSPTPDPTPPPPPPPPPPPSD